MTKIALIGDSHADQYNRLEEHNRIMQWIGEDASARGVDVFLHSGDVWERRSTSEERIAVADYMRQWTDHAPLVVVAGNHDDPLDIEWLGRLRTKNKVHAVRTPHTIDVAGCTVACLPWPRKGHLLAQVGDMSREQTTLVAAEALRSILRGLNNESDMPRLLLSHCSVRGSRVSMSQPPLVGCDFELGLEDLALAGADFYALGHIHLGAGNDWEIDNSPVVYPGSPRRCNFGESEAKCYVVIEFDGQRLVGWERVETPCTPMLLLESTWQGDCFTVPDADVSAVGAEIRFRYRVDSDKREAALAAAKRLRDHWLSVGAVSVKLEPEVIAVTRSRAPEVAKASSLREQLEELWRSKGFEPGSRREPLLDKLVVLEGAAE